MTSRAIVVTDCRGCGRTIVICRKIHACERCGTVYAGGKSSRCTPKGAAIVRCLALSDGFTRTSDIIWALYYVLGNGNDEPEHSHAGIRTCIRDNRPSLARAGLKIFGWKKEGGYRLAKD